MKQVTSVKILNQQFPILNWQSFYLKSIDSQSQDQKPSKKQLKNVNQPKVKKSIIIPYNMHKDYESFLNQNNIKKKQLKALLEENRYLKEQEKIKQKQMRQAQKVLYKVSSVLPQRKQKIQKYYITQEKKHIEMEQIKIRQDLQNLKRKVKLTQNKQYQIYLQQLKKYNTNLNAALSNLTLNNNTRSKQLNHELISEIQNQRHKDQEKLRKQYILQNEVTMVLKQKQLIKLQNNLKQYKHKLELIKFQNQGLQYECEIMIKDNNSIGGLQNQIKKTLKSIQMKEEKKIMLKKIINQKVKSLQYINKWTQDLKKCLQVKKQQQNQIKKKLQAKINDLTKQFQQYNSKYKSLQIEDQASKVKRTKQYNKIQNIRHVPNRIKSIKIYQIQNICKKINYTLTLLNSSTIQFINYLLRQDNVISIKTLYERLKTITYLEKQADLIKVARYIVEDNLKQTALTMYTSINKNIAADVIRNMIGMTMSGKDYREQMVRVKKIMQKHYECLRQQLQGLNKVQFFNQQKLKEGISFLCLKDINEKILKHVCIQLFEVSGEIDNYSILNLKKCFYNAKYIKVEQIE